jgi:hypothetical protein
MLGYIAFLSLILYVTGLLATVSAESVKQIVARGWYLPTRTVFISAYTLCASNLFITTLLALYYMADRIHRPDSREIADFDEHSRPEKAAMHVEC